MRKRNLGQGISYLWLHRRIYTALSFGILFFISGCNIGVAQAEWRTGKPERIISFSGYDWLVKSSRNEISGTMAPGNNYFSDSMENVWVDKNGWLHLKITRKYGKWYCAEVTLTKPLGYKRYIFQVNSRVDLFHQNVVGGLFTYLDGKDHTEEIDIEFSKWGNNNNANNMLYAIQPSDSLGNKHGFNLELNGDATTHLFDWKPGRVDFASYYGHYSATPKNKALVINEWNYFGRNVPVNENMKIHINLWLFQREKVDPDDSIEAEMIIRNFRAL